MNIDSIHSATLTRILGGMIALVGLGFLVAVIIYLARADASGAWPATQGRIITSEVVAVPQLHGTTDHLIVRYSYEVDGVSHTHDKYSYRDAPTGRQARRIAGQLAPGTPVRVCYDPHNPHLAVLEPGTTTRTCLWMLGMPVVLLAIGAWLWLKGGRMPRGIVPAAPA